MQCLSAQPLQLKRTFFPDSPVSHSVAVDEMHTQMLFSYKSLILHSFGGLVDSLRETIHFKNKDGLLSLHIVVGL